MLRSMHMQQQELQEGGPWPPRLTRRAAPEHTVLSGTQQEEEMDGDKDGRNQGGPYSGPGHTHLVSQCAKAAQRRSCTGRSLLRQAQACCKEPTEVAASGTYSIKTRMPSSEQNNGMKGMHT